MAVFFAPVACLLHAIMLEALQTIQSFVAPVVMISANGLLCLAFYNRLAAVVHRVREINKERFDLAARLVAIGRQPPDPTEAAHLEGRVAVLDELGHQLFDRARLIRDALVCLLLAVVAMLACSLALGLGSLSEVLEWVALTCFVVGTVVMMGGVVRAIQELWLALDPLRFEHDMLEQPSENGTAKP
jgi:hypothetical protein